MSSYTEAEEAQNHKVIKDEGNPGKVSLELIIYATGLFEAALDG